MERFLVGLFLITGAAVLTRVGGRSYEHADGRSALPHDRANG